jgi:quinol monooxygenase YgiN
VSAPAGRQLFVYWKTDAALAREAAQAAASMQAALMRQHAGLAATLLRRADDAGTQVTLMEVYASAEEIDAALRAAIERAAAEGLTRYLTGARHTEVFDAI